MSEPEEKNVAPQVPAKSWEEIEEAQKKQDHQFCWTDLLQDSTKRAKYSEYEQERMAIKQAIGELADEYRSRVGNDPQMASILDEVKKYSKINADAQHGMSYSSELKSHSSIIAALEKMADGLAERQQKNVEKMRALKPDDKEFAKKEIMLLAEGEALDNEEFICQNLLSYFYSMQNGTLKTEKADEITKLTVEESKTTKQPLLSYKQREKVVVFNIADPSKSLNVDLFNEDKLNEDQLNKNKINKEEQHITYIIDAHGANILGGETDSARGANKGPSGRKWLRNTDAKDIPLFPHDPCMNDVSQGGLGDCWFVNSISNMARLHPEKIRDMMVDNGDGTVTVRLFGRLKQGGPLEPIQVRVDKIIPKLWYGQVQGGENCLWVNVLERAAAAAGLGDRFGLRVVPPDINEKYEELSKKPNRTAEDATKYPWLFGDRGKNLNAFSKWQPNYGSIVGGEDISALQMLTGEDHIVKEDVSFSTFSTEINAVTNAKNMLESPENFLRGLFRAAQAEAEYAYDVKRNVEGVEQPNYLGLVIDKAYCEKREEYKDCQKIAAKQDWVHQKSDKSGELEVMTVVDPNFTNTITGQISSVWKQTMADWKSMKNAKNDKISLEDDNLKEVLKRMNFTSEHGAHIMSQLIDSMRVMIEEKMKPEMTLEERKDAIKAAGKKFEETSIFDLVKKPLRPYHEEQKQNFYDDEKILEEMDVLEVYALSYAKVFKAQMLKSLPKILALPEQAAANKEDKLASLVRKIQKGKEQGALMSAGVNGKSKDYKPLIPDGHAYSVLDAFEDPNTHQKYIRLRNPWGSSMGNGIIYNSKGEPKIASVKDGIFDIKMEDFFKECDDFSHTEIVMDQPKVELDKDAQIEQPKKEEPSKFTSEMCHTYQRFIKDTYVSLIATKTFPYSNTTKKFNDVIAALKDAEANLYGARGKDINDDKVGLKDSIKNLREKMKTYAELCKGTENAGRHPQRLAAMKQLEDVFKANVLEDKVTDPLKEPYNKIAGRMIDAYCTKHNVTMTVEQRAQNVAMMTETSIFKNMFDGKNVFTLDKLSDKEIVQSMDKYEQIQKGYAMQKDTVLEGLAKTDNQVHEAKPMGI